jgi:hypothetical protein
MGLRIVVIKLFGLHFSFSRPEEARSLMSTAFSCSSRAIREGRKSDDSLRATTQR